MIKKLFFIFIVLISSTINARYFENRKILESFVKEHEIQPKVLIHDVALINTIIPSTNNVLYVNKNVSGGDKSGNSWANAIPELADALIWAHNNQDTAWSSNPLQIWVAGGTYTPLYSPEDGSNFGTNQTRGNAFLMVGNVNLYGNFKGTEKSLSERDLSLTENETILSGDLNNDDDNGGDNSENTYHVVIACGNKNNAILDGFTITKGNANGGSEEYLVSGNAIRYNQGGGMFFLDTSSTIKNVSITKNTASFGGGIYNYEVPLKLNNATISNNTASSYGGGVYDRYSSAVLSNVLITENTAISGGGLYGFGTRLKLINSCISNNRASMYGGGCYYTSTSKTTMVNTTLIKNISQSNSTGHAIYNHLYSRVTIGNSIIFGIIRNTSSATYTSNHSIIEGSSNTLNGNIDASGLSAFDIFTDPTNNDYSLLSSSPAVNAGNNSIYTGIGGNLNDDTDLTGNTRYLEGVIDIGPNEYQVIHSDSSNILYVNKNVSTGNGSGNSWKNAIPELADALLWAHNNQNTEWASTPLQIWVASGIYNPLYSPEDGADFGTNQTRDNAFLLVKNVQIYGSFSGAETNVTDRSLTSETYTSILSGDINKQNDISDNTYHVLLATENVGVALIDGFTISKGNANDSGSITVNSQTINRNYGGGIFLYNHASPTFNNIIINTNSASVAGGGMYCSLSSAPTITDAIFKENTSADNGGAMYLNSSSLFLNKVSFYENVAGNLGGAIYNYNYADSSLFNVTITNNRAENNGGGIYNFSSFPSISNTFISNNNAKNGGGMANFNSSPKMFNATLANNTAVTSGGGIFNDNNSAPTLINVLIHSNSAMNGGGVYNNNSSSNFTNVTLALNNADSGSGFYNVASTFKITNSVLWDTFYNYSGSYTTNSHSFIMNSNNTSNGNINALGFSETDVFTDPYKDDFSLKSGSPALNVGSNDAYTNAGGDLSNDNDLGGNTRFYGGIIDLGCYESEEITLGNHHHILDEMFSISPNPTTGSFTVKPSFNSMIEKLELYNVSGRIIKTVIPNSGLENVNVDISNLSSAIYWIKIYSNAGISVSQIIKH
ncbi:right-handed parallel beta-helix repeat-containing protein [Wenyingzhuangia sp. chi5]|uniref:Right-handed parallel beta-helix repeat-containing protein n=1 Tax=Wenyingzhuangia gilva TaxID=3057677 RepID=A0ABT8VN48_9FLAO|nr:T9SS type A sorting domain-containing protein [Wenyingzhuangia sp. chi5]MDO3693396.1 right-handed parallel beta-helix repeat-containing protein [Wenyingzhuangia sp. chi5]